MRRITTLILVTLLAMLSAAPASAGGSWLEPTWVRVEAGDHLVLEGSVSIGQLGWVEDGPFFAYLIGETYGRPLVEGVGGSETDVLLGQVVITDVTEVGAHLSVELTMPDDTPRGSYLVTVCNDPCTTGFGDLIGSQLFVGMDPVDDELDATASDPYVAGGVAVTGAGAASVSPDPITTEEPVLEPTVGVATEMPLAEGETDPVLIAGLVLVAALVIGGLYRLSRRSPSEPMAGEERLVDR